MNPISKYWLKRRQRIPRLWVHNSLVLDVGARSEKLVPNSIGLDIIRSKNLDVQADAQYLPFRSNIATTVVACELIEHLDYAQLSRFLREAARAGEALLISTPNADSVSWQVFWWLWRNTGGRTWKDQHIGLYCKEFLDSLFTTFGFRIVSFEKTRWSLFYLLENGTGEQKG